jgi:hypothetical protein
MTEGMSYEAFGRAHRRILFEEWYTQTESGHLTEQGLLAIRARLLFTEEFDKEGDDRKQLLLAIRAAYQTVHGGDEVNISLGPELDLPEDLTELDELTPPDDASELDEPPES